jgi:DNA-binding winged helix-turn-helix (wHTH) protein/tetratricopeptide (TPR) repeat protein
VYKNAVGDYVFGEFVLDGARLELRRSGERVPIQPKVLRLLLHLARHRDRVVSNPELLKALWPDEVVSPGSIKRAVRSARQTLGESADGPSSIRTARGHGYQFVAEVVVRAELARSEPKPRAPAPVLPPATHAQRREIAIERNDLQRALEDSWSDTERAEGHALLLFGEAGVGKSHALRRLCAHARQRGGIAWFGRAAEAEGAPPYWPLISMLRDALQNEGRETWLELMGPQAVDLAQALPELRGFLTHGPEAPAIEPAAARFRFFDSMLSFLQRAAESRPFLLIVDDLPLADAPSASLFAFLARHSPGHRILLAASLRQGHLARASQQQGDLVSAFGHARHVHLSGFSHAEVASFVEAHTGDKPGDALVQRMTELTAGNALILTHLVRLCRPTSVLGTAPRWEKLETIGLRHGLANAIEHHLRELSRASRDCLCAAAQIGRSFSPLLLAQLLEQEPLQVDEWLLEAQGQGLISATRDVGETSGHKQFAHGLVREALVASTPLAHRQRLHARVARLLAEEYGRGGAEAAKVAYHFFEAGRHDQSLHFHMLAARLALAQLAAEDAVQHYERALSSLGHLPEAPQLRVAITIEQGHALVQMGSFSQGRATLLQAAQHARELGDSALMARAALTVATPMLGEVDQEVVDALREALAGLPPEDDLRALVLCALAKTSCYSGDLAQRSQLVQAAVPAARKLRDPSARARALLSCHEAMCEPDQLAARRELLAEVVAHAHATSDLALSLRSARSEIQNASELGDMQSLEVALSLLERRAEAARDPIYRWHTKTFKAMCAFVQGRVHDAVAIAEEALQLGSNVGERTARHVYLCQLNGYLRLLGDSARARELTYEASARYPSFVGWRAALALAEFDLGRQQAAQEIFESLMAEGVPALRRDAFVLSALCPVAELSIWFGTDEHSTQLYDALRPYAKYCGTVAYAIATNGPITRYLGLLAARLRRYDAAAAHFEAARRSSREMRSPTFIAATAICEGISYLLGPAPAWLRNHGFEQVRLADKLARLHGFVQIERLCAMLAASSSQLQDAPPQRPS